MYKSGKRVLLLSAIIVRFFFSKLYDYDVSTLVLQPEVMMGNDHLLKNLYLL